MTRMMPGLLIAERGERLKRSHRASPWPGRLAAGLLACVLALSGCQREGSAGISVLASDTMLAAIVREIGGDRVRVKAIIPAEESPGAFELSPRALEEAAGADLVILTGLEKWGPRIAAAAFGEEHVSRLGVTGDLMLPYFNLEAADSITVLLMSLDPTGNVFYTYNRSEYKSRLAAETEDICASMADIAGTMVICSARQAEFLDYLGFDIVGTYGPSGEVSAGEISHLIDVGRRNNVAIVVDDYYDDGHAGRQIAAGTGATRVVLERYPARGSYLDLLRRNTTALIDGVRS